MEECGLLACSLWLIHCLMLQLAFLYSHIHLPRDRTTHSGHPYTHPSTLKTVDSQTWPQTDLNSPSTETGFVELIAKADWNSTHRKEGCGTQDTGEKGFPGRRQYTQSDEAGMCLMSPELLEMARLYSEGRVCSRELLGPIKFSFVQNRTTYTHTHLF